MTHLRKILLFFLLLAVSGTVNAEWKDVTNYYFSTPGFENNQSTGWIWYSDANSQTVNYECFEFWNGVFTIWQEIPEMPKGKYRLTFQGYYRMGDFEAVYDTYLNGGESIDAKVQVVQEYIENDSHTGKLIAEKPIASVFSDSFDRNMPGTWSGNQRDYYPNNMETAALAFSQGKYVNTLEFEVTESGFVSIQLSNSDAAEVQPSNWCIFDNFKLEFDGELVTAQGISVSILDSEIMVGRSTYCQADITPENVATKNVTWTSSDVSVATVDQNGKVTGLAPGNVTITATTTDGTNLSASVQLTVKSDEDISWMDVTDVYFTNPGFDNSSTEGWEWWSNASSQQANYNCFEFWNGYFNMTQTLKGLPPGLYRLSAQAFYRTAENNIAYNNYQNGTETIPCTLYAGQEEMPVKSIYSFSFDDYSNNCWSPNWFGGPYYPNGMESASEAFSRNAYVNKVIFDIAEQQDVEVGIYSYDNNYSNWCTMTNFKLEYSGNVILVNHIDLTIEKSEIIESETVQCTAVITPGNALKQNLEWTSSNPNVATVDENGLVKGVGLGTSTITAAATDGSGVKASVRVRVVKGGTGEAAIIINEIMASNVDEYVSPAYNFDGWVELYNPTDQPVRLAGLHLSDDPSNLTYWKMPANMSVIPAHGYTVVWFDSNVIKTDQAPFKLDVEGGTLYLSDENGKTITSQAYPESMERVSYARKTDGTGQWGFCGTPTPGKSNDNATFADTQLQAPVVDAPSQLFSGSLSVNVTIPTGCVLRYTADGTLPTLTNGETSTTGQFSVNSTSIYRFRLFADGMLPSRVTTRSYIFRDQDYMLPVLSVVSDPDFLYSNEMGVLVKGTNGRPGNGQSSKCNWNMEWERPVNFSYITPDGEMVLNQDVNLEMCGGWSRAWNPKAFKLKGADELGGSKTLSYPFFDNKPYIRNRTLQIRNGGNDNNCRIKDPALQQIVMTSGIDVDVQSYQPVHEFINGQYMGVLNMREPNNKHYVYANYGWSDDEIDQFEMSPDSGYVQKCGTAEVYNELVDILSADASNSETYAEICRVLDIDEYINYMAIEMYLGNWDWPQNNVKGFRKSDGGKFRFVLFDLDGSFNTDDPFGTFEGKEIYRFDQLYPTSLGRITEQIRFVTLFRNLLQNDQFKKKFIDTYCLIGGSVFEANRVIGIVNTLADRVNPAMRLEGGSVNSTANSIRNYFNGRVEQATVSLRNYWALDLNGTTAQRASLRSDVANAQILVNGIQMPTGTFNGYLFPPVTLRAVAPAGYAFEGWLKNGGKEYTIFDNGSEWSYYDQGSLDGTNWTSPTYNEAGWKKGNAPLGYGKDGVSTTLDYGRDQSNKRPTAYFRTKINFEKAPTANDRVTLNFTIDDGFIVYVNGTMCASYNMPSNSVRYNTYASTYAPNNPDTGVTELRPELFHTGDNVIAVEVHNNSGSSTDMLWDASITTTVSQEKADFYSTDAEIALPSGSVNLTASYRPLTEAEKRAEGFHPVCINEISGSNDSYINEYGKKNDWVELYNTTDADIDIEGMYLSNDINQPAKYQITKGSTSANTVIPAYGHLLIWCDQLTTTSKALHAPFKISGNGGQITLTAADKSWTDVVYYDAHDGNSTVGRYPDGAATVYLMSTPTIEKTNILTSYMTEVDQTTGISHPEMLITSANGLRICYGSQQLIVKSEEATSVLVSIYTSDGRLADQVSTRVEHGTARVDVSHLAPGFYIAKAADADNTRVACKFVK